MSGENALGASRQIDFRSGPHRGVAPSSNGFRGGSLARSGRPTDVQGGFSIVKADAGTPTGVRGASITEARNNRGSNVRIPYARLVPMHNKDKLEVKDTAVHPDRDRSRRMAFEYDGLESGELAWIMSLNYRPQNHIPGGAGDTSLAEIIEAPAYAYPSKRVARQADEASYGAFTGFGVDRMQRLAYTNWMEAFYEQRLGRQWINLMDSEVADLGNETNCRLDSKLDDYKLITTGFGLFAVPDVAYATQFLHPSTFPHARPQIESPLPQGLFVMEKGPFLRSMGTDTDPVVVRVPFGPKPIGGNKFDGDYGLMVDQAAPRHLGGELAQRGLYCVLKKAGVFNWVPDGIVLSKLETGPSPSADAELDARSGQLFNVAIQGPAITKTWTLGDTRMICQPMDKVFVLVVGDLSYELAVKKETDHASNVTVALRKFMRPPAAEAEARADAAAEAAKAAETAAAEAAAAAARAEEEDATPEIQTEAANAANLAAADAAEAAEAAEKARNNMEPTDPNIADVYTTSDTTYKLNMNVGENNVKEKLNDSGKPLLEALRKVKFPNSSGDVAPKKLLSDLIEKQQAYIKWCKDNEAELRASNEETLQTKTEVEAELTKLHEELKGTMNNLESIFEDKFEEAQKAVLDGRAVVSKAVLTNLRLLRCTSSYLTEYSRPQQGKDKSRLGLGISFNGNSGAASFVLGGWCVGTVLDAAASRQAQASVVRVAPQSMAMNVNVNIEWWSADDLHGRYGDYDVTDGNRRTVSAIQTRTEKNGDGRKASPAYDDKERMQKVAVISEAAIDAPDEY